MTQFFRSGYYQYDKPAKPAKVCRACGNEFTWGSATRKYCGPCYDIRSQANIAKNRHKYRKPKKHKHNPPLPTPLA